MTNRSVSVTLTANIAAYMAALRTAGAATAQFAASGTKLASDVGLISTKMTALGTAVGFTAAYGVTTMAKFEQAMSLVQATTEASIETMGRLREAALAVGGETQFTPTQAAEGITILSKAGVDAADILGGGLTGAMNLAAAGEMDVAEAGQIAASALNTFRLEGEQMPHVADLLASTANEAQGEVHDLGFALRMTAAVAAQTGMTIEETMAGLGAMANRGLINSDAGTSMKSFLIHLVPTTDTAAAAMERIGLSAFNARGEFIGLKAVAEQLQNGLANLSEEQQLVELRTIFGTDAIRAASVMYAEGAEGIQEWIEANRDGYAADFAATINDNLIGDLKKLNGELHTLFIEAGQGANGPLRELSQSLTGILTKLNELNKLTEDKTGVGLFGSMFDVAGNVRGLFNDRPEVLGGTGLWDDKLFGGPRIIDIEGFFNLEGTDEAAAMLETIDSMMVASSGSAEGLAAAADRAAAATRDLGTSAAGAAGGVASLDEQMKAALAGAMSYIDGMQAVSGASRDLLGMEDALRASATYTIPASGSGGGGGSSKTSAAETKARNDRIKAMREADNKKMQDEIERARKRAQAKAEARADREARGEVQEGVKEFIDTDKKAKRGENIDGFNNTNEVGEKTGKLTEKEQKRLDKEIEGIRERHKKALDAQIKALRDAQKAAGGTASATTRYTTSLDKNTAAGRRNLDTINAQVDKVQAYAQSTYDSVILNGGSVEEAGKAARDALMEGYELLMQSAESADYATDQVEDFLAKLGLIPDVIETILKVQVDDSELTDLEKRWKELEKAEREKAKELATPSSVPLPTKPTPTPTPTPTKPPATVPKATTVPPLLKKPPAFRTFASGGEVYGPGTTTSDSIAARLSQGEYVVRASAYAANRDLVRAINSGALKPGGGGVGVYIEGGVNVTAPSPAKAGENVIDELDMYAYRKGAVR